MATTISSRLNPPSRFFLRSLICPLLVLRNVRVQNVGRLRILGSGITDGDGHAAQRRDLIVVRVVECVDRNCALVIRERDDGIVCRVIDSIRPRIRQNLQQRRRTGVVASPVDSVGSRVVDLRLPGMKIPPVPGSVLPEQALAFWISSQLICEVLRAVMMLSYASFASCLAIMFCCEACVVDIASPNTPADSPFHRQDHHRDQDFNQRKSFLRLLPRPEIAAAPGGRPHHPGFADY